MLTTVKGSVLNRGVNVKDFGTKGDGVTDDTAAIQRFRMERCWLI